MEPGQITTAVYRNTVPPFAEADLDRLYGHVFSSLAQFLVYDGVGADTHTYAARRGDETIAIFLFRIEDRMVQVLNEQINVHVDEIERFVRHAFATFPTIEMVSFQAVRIDGGQVPFPHQQFYRTEDIVLTLPGSADEYLDSLGKATRKNMKYHANRLKRNFPQLTFEVYLDDQILPQDVRDIFELNRARMANKNKTSEMDEVETARVARLVRSRGLVSVMRIDGRVCAGTVCSRVGDNYFMHINAHDPAYDDARLGKLCCYFTIRDCIERGGSEFHFLWGRFGFKYLMLGVQQDFDQLVVYRSPARFIKNAGVALPIAFNGYLRKVKFRLLDIANHPESGGFTSRLIFRSVNYLRHLKQSAGRTVAARQ
jgi:hypothetical protein